MNKLALDIIGYMEYTSYRYRTGIASGSNVFIRIIELSGEYQELVPLLNEEVSNFIIKLINKYILVEEDSYYAHPYDELIAIYFLILHKYKPIDPEHISFIHELQSLGLLDRLFWSRMVLGRLVSNNTTLTSQNQSFCSSSSS